MRQGHDDPGRHQKDDHLAQIERFEMHTVQARSAEPTPYRCRSG